MSRQSIMPPRSLTLTEELERLEQSITLVLQEIDHNFSRAHRIVSGSIIPIVEQYSKHSDAVWEGSKFWKQFFEASANVSLSSYEEVPEEDYTVTEQSNISDDHATEVTAEDDTITAKDEQAGVDSPSTNDATQGTPAQSRKRASIAEYSSPYESLRNEMGDSSRPTSSRAPNEPPSTPGGPSTAHAQTPLGQPSPGAPPSTGMGRFRRQNNDDPLLHRVLDKTFRVAATPHTAHKKPAPPSATTQTHTHTQASSRATNPALDSSPFSPAMAAPELRSEIFGSPGARPPRGGGAGGAGAAGARTPGVSVLKGKAKTPLSHRRNDSTSKNPLTAERQQRTPTDPTTWNDRLWDSDSDTNDDIGVGGMSPPKTMQFHVPQSRLMQTPAKEASRRIVEDLLLTAGAASVTSTLEEFDIDLDVGGGQGGVGDEDSPSIVRMARREDDDDDF